MFWCVFNLNEHVEREMEIPAWNSGWQGCQNMEIRAESTWNLRARFWLT